ncbi:uncharacterized protein LOC118802515 isoform X1 [Colossoma macropomum]|uniref:uncharacterized protein LOC118802515 isoform X1 n=1 Tax=Colossoma macropomum TaxID=42526 RepID=UPI001864D558|nr:uncharacterized protein LOC118802515 isoform X1 [Colossoma macropomum]
MGAKVSVKNETPYTWYYSRSSSRGFQAVSSGSRAEYGENKAIHCYIYLRYEKHSWNTFSYEFNTHKGDPTFTLRESYDRSCIQLHCSTERNVPQCPNYDPKNPRKRRTELRAAQSSGPMLINAGCSKKFHCSTQDLSRFSTCGFSVSTQVLLGKILLLNHFMGVSILVLECVFRLLYPPLNLMMNSVSVCFDAASVAAASDSSIY